MHNNRRIVILGSILVVIALIIGARTWFDTPAPIQKPHGVGVVVVAHATPTPFPTAADTFPMPTNYTAQDIYDYFLWRHLPIRVNFCLSVDFPQGIPPDSFVGFEDYTSQGITHCYVIAVFKDETDTQYDYEAMHNTYQDAIVVSNRCMLVGDTTTVPAINSNYLPILRDGCSA